MQSRRSLLWSLAVPAMLGAAVLVTGASHAGPDRSPIAVIGKLAPNFTLKDASDETYTLADYKGKVVVLQWINPGCPVCRRVHTTDVVENMTKELKRLDADIVLLDINSTRDMDAKASAKYLKDHDSATPGLDDHAGTVGRLYGAKTTPHLYVIDQEGILRYSGAIDDDPSGAKGEAAVNYVVNAVSQIKAGETVAPDSMKPYGCSVKYAKK